MEGVSSCNWNDFFLLNLRIYSLCYRRAWIGSICLVPAGTNTSNDSATSWIPRSERICNRNTKHAHFEPKNVHYEGCHRSKRNLFGHLIVRSWSRVVVEKQVLVLRKKTIVQSKLRLHGHASHISEHTRGTFASVIRGFGTRVSPAVQSNSDGKNHQSLRKCAYLISENRFLGLCGVGTRATTDGRRRQRLP